MTHLDVGFTHDTSVEVLEQYFNQWFPQAFELSDQLRALGLEESFGWTTHPWLIVRTLYPRPY